VSVGKSVKIIPADAVLPPRQTEGGQVTIFNPAQDGYFTHPAVARYRAGG
jgi:hypothetical protein